MTLVFPEHCVWERLVQVSEFRDGRYGPGAFAKNWFSLGALSDSRPYMYIGDIFVHSHAPGKGRWVARRGL